MTNKLIPTMLLATMTAISFSSFVTAETVEKVVEKAEYKAQTPTIGNKQANLQELFNNHVEEGRRRQREAPLRAAQESARVKTGLVGKWIYSATDSNGKTSQYQSWIRSDGTVLYYQLPDPSEPAPVGGFVIRPFARNTWGYQDGIYTEKSDRGTSSYAVDWVSRDEFVLETVSSYAAENVGDRYTYRIKSGIGSRIPK